MIGNLEFHSIHNSVGSKAIYNNTKCHEFIKESVSTLGFSFIIPKSQLGTPLKDVILVMNKVNELAPVHFHYIGEEPVVIRDTGYTRSNYIFAADFEVGSPANAINLVALNIIRWTFQDYAEGTIEAFLGYIKDRGIDPLRALLMAQMRRKSLCVDHYRVIVDGIQNVPLFFTIKQYINVAKGSIYNKNFQKIFASGISITGKEAKEIQQLLINGKVDEFIELAKKKYLWIDKS